jgi:DNA mismatch endonuclease (patch repair protein)
MISPRQTKSRSLVGVDPLRSRIMRAVRRTDTRPELVVRKLVHALGFRFRLHRKDLPGTPDLVLPRLNTVIFVHGCFWHRHASCAKTTMPKTRVEFWREKFDANTRRDARKNRQLRTAGWRVIVIWECETSDSAKLSRKLTSLLSSKGVPVLRDTGHSRTTGPAPRKR